MTSFLQTTFCRSVIWSSITKARPKTKACQIVSSGQSSLIGLGLSLGVGALGSRNLSDLRYGSEVSLNGFNNYEEGIRNFKLEVPKHFNFASDVVDRWAAREQVGH